jgi:outer membrane receptor for ferrienterochelin and colicin
MNLSLAGRSEIMKIKNLVFWIRGLLLLFLILPVFVFSGTTGKIVGVVIDVTNGETLPGVNVVVEGTTMGAATDINGFFQILNIPPGSYTIKASIIGYNASRISQVRVSADLTTKLEFKLEPTVLEVSEVVTITAEREVIKKDLTATSSIVGSDEIKNMPVQEVGQVLQLQVGWVDGHMRGGRSGEVVYWIDGIPATDVYNGGLAVTVENDNIQELQVISGTFNAEYGKAMSAVINTVIKEGGDKYDFNFTSYLGSYLVSDDNSKMYRVIKETLSDTLFKGYQRKSIGEYPIYENPLKINPLHQYNFQGSISGPVPFTMNKIGFYLNARKFYNDGWIHGINLFEPVKIEKYKISGPQNKTIFITNAGDTLNMYMRDKKIIVEQKGKSSISIDSPDSTFYSSPSRVIRPEDRKLVSMNFYDKFSFQGKLTFKIIPTIKFTYLILWDNIEFKNANDYHVFQYNPFGQPKELDNSYNHIFTLTHTLTSTTFYEVKFSSYFTEYKKFTFDDPEDILEKLKKGKSLDSRYQHGDYLNETGFKSTGTILQNFHRSTTSNVFKFDITSQVTPQHQAKAGIEIALHELFQRDFTLIDATDKLLSQQVFQNFGVRLFTPALPPESALNNNTYKVNPRDFSVYIQDKMEYGDMIVNFGIRFDLYDANGRVLADETDPNIFEPFKSINIWKDLNKDGKIDSIDTNNDGKMDVSERVDSNLKTLAERKKYWYKKTNIKYQIGPRFGIAYPITDRGVIHFSFGHFLQMPSYENLYKNYDFKIPKGAGDPQVIGNANLKPEKTVMYEIGLQQQLFDDIGIDITGFYKDVRDWLGTSPFIETALSGITYSKYINRDYANVRGITFQLNKRLSNYYSASIDYSLQFAEGSASNPDDAFNDAKANRAPRIALVPMGWDQRHTLNTNITIGTDRWNIGLIGRLGSGQPYTPRVVRGELTGRSLTQDISENSENKPYVYVLDLKLFRAFRLFGDIDLVVFANVFNLLDRRNEVQVFDDTGRANVTFRQSQYSLDIPYHYDEPRRIQMGLTFGF